MPGRSLDLAAVWHTLDERRVVAERGRKSKASDAMLPVQGSRPGCPHVRDLKAKAMMDNVRVAVRVSLVTMSGRPKNGRVRALPLPPFFS